MPSQGCAPTAGFLLLGLLAAQSHGIIQVTALAHGVLGWFLRNACVTCLEQSLCPSSSPAPLEAEHFCWWDQNDRPNAQPTVFLLLLRFFASYLIPGRNGPELLLCFALTFSLFESGYLLTSSLL